MRLCSCVVLLLGLTGLSYADTLDFPGSIPGSTVVVGTSTDGSNISIGTYQTEFGCCDVIQLGFSFHDDLYTSLNPLIFTRLPFVAITSVNSRGDYTGYEYDQFGAGAGRQFGFASIFPFDDFFDFFHQNLNEIVLTKPSLINDLNQIFGVFGCGQELDCGTVFAPIEFGTFLIDNNKLYIDAFSSTRGQISQFSQRPDGTFALTPVPEPPTWFLLLSTLTLLATCVRKKFRCAQ
jgi:hypothetical protein